MRLISSNGLMDVPYERCTLSVGFDDDLFTIESDLKWETLGTFPTREKAVNELKKIRTAYASGRTIYKIGE